MRNCQKTILSLLFILMSSLLVTAEQNSNSYEQDLKYLLQINGSEASYQQSIQTMFLYLKGQENDVPIEYWERAEVEFLNTSINSLISMLTPIYKQNLSHEDVLAMIQFYESEAGKRIAQKLPKLTTESMQVGMTWGQTIGEKIRADIESKGFKIRLPFTP